MARFWDEQLAGVGLQSPEMGKTLGGIDFGGGIRSSFLDLLRVRCQECNLRY